MNILFADNLTGDEENPPRFWLLKIRIDGGCLNLQISTLKQIYMNTA